MKKILLTFILLCIFSGFKYSLAEDSGIPSAIQTALLVKALSYDKTLSSISSNDINICIVYDSNSKSQANRDEINKTLKSLEKGIGGKNLDISSENASSISSIKNKNIHVIFMAEGISSPTQVSKFSAENGIITVASDTEYVKSGNASITAYLKNNKPKMLVNLKNVKKENHDLSAQLLKLCEIIE